jgi:hypothetical protein
VCKRDECTLACLQLTHQTSPFYSQHTESTRHAKAVWIAPPLAPGLATLTIPALARFGSQCASSCTSSCCNSGTCSASCACKVACFRLVYYDDAQPSVSYMSSSTGPSSGGAKLLVSILGLPVIHKGVSKINVVFDQSEAGTANLVSSSSAETTVDVYTPAVHMGIMGSRTVTASLWVDSQPDKVAQFSYMYTNVVPLIDSVTPSILSSDGGSYASVRLLHFPFPTMIGVSLGGSDVPLSTIQVSSASGPEVTYLTVRLPDSPSGNQTLAVYPRKEGMEGGRGASTLVFVQDSKLRIVDPIPSGGLPVSNQRTMKLRLKNYPTNYPSTYGLFFTSWNNTVTRATVNSFELVDDGVSTLTFIAPSSAHPYKGHGTFYIFPEFESVQQTELVFPFEWYNHTVMRLVDIAPSVLPTSMTLYGRHVEFENMTATLRFANFPTNVPQAEMAIFVNQKQARLISLFHSSDSKMSTIIFAPGTVPGPSSYPVEIWGSGRSITNMSLTFFTPCAQDKFCDALKLTGNIRPEILFLAPCQCHRDQRFCLMMECMS